MKVRQYFLLLLESLTLQILWNAFCDSGMLWKICVDFLKQIKKDKEKSNPKSQNACHNICRVRDSEHNKNIVLASKLQDL